MSQLDLNAIVQQKLNGGKASRIEDAIAMSFYGDGVATITNAINRHTEAADESLARNNAIREKLDGTKAAHTAYATRLDKQDDLRQGITKNVAASATNAMDLFAALIAKR